MEMVVVVVLLIEEVAEAVDSPEEGVVFLTEDIRDFPKALPEGEVVATTAVDEEL